MSGVYYVYVDESGQNDSRGDALHVGIVVVQSSSREEVQGCLESYEQTLGKRGKWSGSSVKIKTEYLRSVLSQESRLSLYWFRSGQPCDYEEATAAAAARAMQKTMAEDGQFIVIIDGLKKTCRQRVAKVFRAHQVRWRDILINKREESDALLRLADAVAGFMRDVHHDKDFTRTLWPQIGHAFAEI